MNEMTKMLLERVLWSARDEGGAELVEYVVWVGLLAVMGGAIAVVLQGGLTAAITAIVAIIAPS
jgi:Flp pilus assembly pilin Flp